VNNILSFYFDGLIVQAVKVSISGNSVAINDVSTFPLHDFEDYLSLCREKSCIVCCNPPHFYQDIVHLPPAAGRLYGKLVRAEVQKTHPDLTSFSIFFRIVGESMIETRPYNKIAVFSYPDDFLSDFISEINRFRITITHIYAAPCSILRLALSTCALDPNQPRIFIATLLGEKLLLISENSELEFIRKIPSLDSDLLPEDTNNINMTVDYCFQSLRMRPTEVVMINQPERADELSHLVSVPYRSVLPPRLDNMPPRIIQDYLAPVAAAMHSVDSPGMGNIMPSDYAAFTMHKKVFAVTTIVLSLFILLLTGYLVKETMTISALKSKIGRMRTELSGSAGEIATFRKLDAETNRLKQPLDLINKQNSTLNPATALAALILPESGDYTIEGIIIKSESNVLNVQIYGAITVSGYRNTQASFEKLVALIAKIPEYTISSSKIDIKSKSFGIQARYNGGGPKSR